MVLYGFYILVLILMLFIANELSKLVHASKNRIEMHYEIMAATKRIEKAIADSNARFKDVEELLRYSAQGSIKKSLSSTKLLEDISKQNGELLSEISLLGSTSSDISLSLTNITSDLNTLRSMYAPTDLEMDLRFGPSFDKGSS